MAGNRIPNSLPCPWFVFTFSLRQSICSWDITVTDRQRAVSSPQSSASATVLLLAYPWGSQVTLISNLSRSECSKKKKKTAKSRLWVYLLKRAGAFLPTYLFATFFWAICKLQVSRTARSHLKNPIWTITGILAAGHTLCMPSSPTPASAPLKLHAVRSYYCKEKCRRGKNIHCCVQGAKWAQREFSPAKFNLCLVSRRVNRRNTETLKFKTFTALSLNYIP